jgi:hypothetical protein
MFYLDYFNFFSIKFIHKTIKQNAIRLAILAIQTRLIAQPAAPIVKVRQLAIV